MRTILRMPDVRLAGFFDSYGYWPLEMRDFDTFSAGLVAFNPLGARIEIDGELRTEPVLMGIAPDPTFIRYSVSGAPLFEFRCRTSAFDRLFGIDPSLDQGAVGLDREKHPIMAELFDRFAALEPTAENWFAFLDENLRRLLDEVKPGGLAQRFIELQSNNNGIMPIASCAEQLGCSVRTLERACRRRFGRSPKRLARGWKLALARRAEFAGDFPVEQAADFQFADLPHYLKELRNVHGRNRTQLAKGQARSRELAFAFQWPDGRFAVEGDDMDEWEAEMARRYESFIG